MNCRVRNDSAKPPVTPELGGCTMFPVFGERFMLNLVTFSSLLCLAFGGVLVFVRSVNTSPERPDNIRVSHEWLAQHQFRDRG